MFARVGGCCAFGRGVCGQEEVATMASGTNSAMRRLVLWRNMRVTLPDEVKSFPIAQGRVGASLSGYLGGWSSCDQTRLIVPRQFLAPQKQRFESGCSVCS